MIFKWYYLFKRFKRGGKLSLFLSMTCNLNCSYCSLNAHNGKHPPSYNELSLDEWKVRLLELFKVVRIKEVFVTGGEPTLRKDVSAIINFLLEQGKFVQLHTNLSNPVCVKPNYRFYVYATLHNTMNFDRAMNTWDHYKDQKNKLIKQIDRDHFTVTTHIEPYEIQGEEIGGQTNRLALSPDGHLFYRMKDFYQHLWSINDTKKRLRCTEACP